MKPVAFAFPLPYRAVAAVTVVALLAWTMGLPVWFNRAEAANVLYMSDTLADSDLGVVSLHTIKFTTPTGMTAGQSFRIYFDNDGTPDFDFSSMDDTDLIATSSGFTAVNTCVGATNEIDLSVNTTSDYVEGTVCAGNSVAAGTTMWFQVGDTGGNRVSNPGTAGSYVISLQGNGATPIADEGDTRVAIIDDVTVTASVNTIFQFSINGVNPGVTVNNDVVPTTGTSTATTVPFGTIAPGAANARLMAQELRVNTNAVNGFSVTVNANQTLTAGNTATIDEFINGVPLASSSAWVSPANTMGSPDTYGHWGLTSDDDSVSSTTPNLWGSGQALYVGNFVNNPVEVFYHDDPVYETAGVGVGSTTVAYKVEITNLQEAAKDYTATLTYVATPIF